MNIDLKSRIIKFLTKASKQPSLTFGVEQEFFLLNADNSVVNHKTSQNFIGSLKSFTQIEIEQDDCLGRYIESVKDTYGNTIKYDHHPYLLEIATAPANNLLDIDSHLQKCFDIILEVAEEKKLKISFNPILHIPTNQPETRSCLKFRKNLIEYRRKLFELRNQSIDENLVNYAAGIISTQVHIGGVPFQQYDKVFQKLIGKEPEIINWSKSHFVSHLNADSVIEHRNLVYTRTFEGSPLVCFPSFEWTTENWLNALFETPLYGSKDEDFSGHTLKEYPNLQSMNEVEFLYRVRDLQWIKPHRQGTIEFRSIPALPTIKSIIELCKIRLNTINEIL